LTPLTWTLVGIVAGAILEAIRRWLWSWFSKLSKMSSDIEELNRKMSNASEHLDREMKYMGQRVDLVSETQFLLQTRLAEIERRLVNLEEASSSEDTEK